MEEDNQKVNPDNIEQMLPKEASKEQFKSKAAKGELVKRLASSSGLEMEHASECNHEHSSGHSHAHNHYVFRPKMKMKGKPMSRIMGLKNPADLSDVPKEFYEREDLQGSIILTDSEELSHFRSIIACFFNYKVISQIY